MTKISRRTFVGALASGAACHSLRTRAAVAAAVPDVLVLGAGLSGLHAARLLEDQGVRVRVLEARDRVGGRVHTRFDLPGHPEMGANNMTPGYARTVDAVRRLRLELVDYQRRFKLTAPDNVAVAGRTLTRAGWAAAAMNPLPAESRSLLPAEYIGTVLSKNNPLARPDLWTAPESASLDRPMFDALRSCNVSEDAIALCYDHNVPYGTSSQDVSALMYWFIDAWGKQLRPFGNAALAVKAGNQHFPEALRGSLRGDVILGREVVAIVQDGSGVAALCRDGSRFSANRMICSLPLPVLGNIVFDPSAPPLLRKAAQTIRYMKVCHFFFYASRPYWKEDGMNPSMWTDGPAGIVFGQRFGATDDDISIISATQRGSLAEAMDRLGPDLASRVIRSYIEEVRPAAAGHLKPLGHHSWSADPYATGGWAIFGPGQVAEFAGKLHTPHQKVHFCGEHTAVSNRGMEAAMESGERAALEVLTEL